MKKLAFILLAFSAIFYLGFYSRAVFAKQSGKNNTGITMDSVIKAKKENSMKLGVFSVSLNVKDISTSKQFYENLGFTVLAGSVKSKFLMMKNGNCLIGLFQGFFKGNILTFNPGWDENAKNIDKFDDVRDIQKHLKSSSIKLTTEADEKTTGPASLTVNDPDGNVILIDQHR